jgi:uroporphyrinogen decarboxylase
MDTNDDRFKAMTWQHPKRIPISAWILPAAWLKDKKELSAIVDRHPAVFGSVPYRPSSLEDVGGTYAQGKHVDVWGCVWSNVKTGMEAIVTGHPVATRSAVRTLTAPQKDAGFPHGFMYLRLADLRGFAELMIDFAEEPPELQMLLDTVLGYNLRQARKWLADAREPRQLFCFGDDLGMQNGLAIDPVLWRKYLKPCFAEIYRPFRDAGHYVYMHTDGHILEIIPDLVDCGVNVVNPQIRANGLDGLVNVCKGKVCVDLDLDRQMFPFCTPADIDEHVHEVVDKLGSPEGGLWLKAEIGDDVPMVNLEAICLALEKYSGYYC